MHRCDVLNLEWASYGRDVDIVEPVLSRLETEFGLRVARDSILDFERKLLAYEPRMLLMSNTRGGAENFFAARLASKLGIVVASLESEGDYLEEGFSSPNYYWGWNSDHVQYEDIQLEWSQRSLDLIRKYIPETREANLAVSGATGFDRFRFMGFMTKAELLAKYGFDGFEEVVGFAGWGFDSLEGWYYDKFGQEVLARVGGPAVRDLHLRARDELRGILHDLITGRPQTLFVLKYHPGTIDESATEFFGLDGFANVVVLRGKSENIADVISACDLWFAYESTSCLEAWMLGRQTMLINPEGSDFKRSRVASGSPVALTADQAMAAMNTYFENQELPGFGELRRERERVESEVIGWADGNNHVRAARHVFEALSGAAKHREVDAWVMRRILKGEMLRLMRVSGLLRLPGLKQRFESQQHLESIFDPAERERVHQAYLEALRRFDA